MSDVLNGERAIVLEGDCRDSAPRPPDPATQPNLFDQGDMSVT